MAIRSSDKRLLINRDDPPPPRAAVAAADAVVAVARTFVGKTSEVIYRSSSRQAGSRFKELQISYFSIRRERDVSILHTVSHDMWAPSRSGERLI